MDNLAFWTFSHCLCIGFADHPMNYTLQTKYHFELYLITVQRPRFDKEHDRDTVDRDRLAARSREPPARERGDFKRPRY